MRSALASAPPAGRSRFKAVESRIDDCAHGTVEMVARNIAEPGNLGSSRLVTVDQLVSIAESIAGIKLQRHYDVTAPQGVRGRNSENTLIRKLLNWEPQIALQTGLEPAYRWIETQISRAV